MPCRPRIHHPDPAIICLNVIGVGRGDPVRCFYLREESGWYRCRAFGFRARASTALGQCRVDGWRVSYDDAMLAMEKSRSVAFCVYRLWSVVGAGAVVNPKVVDALVTGWTWLAKLIS